MSAKVFTVSLAVAVTASWVLLVDGVPPANAAPTSDGQGYVNSTARCGTQDTTVVFGSTDSSRVAICKTPGGGYEYRGVRVRDGAKLIVPAKEAGDGTFEAENYGIVYTVSAKSVVVSEGNKVLREEPMVDFHGPEAAAPAPTATPTPTPTPTPTTPTPTTPLPPPLPAERGGG